MVKRLQVWSREKYAHSAVESNPMPSWFGGRGRSRSRPVIPLTGCGVTDTGMVLAKAAEQRSGIMTLRIRTQSFRPAAPIAVAALCALAAASSARAGDPPRRLPTFTSDVDVVNLNVSVTDSKDRYVAGLGAGDFEVFEDGVRQQL